jgi:hypothetical protein
MKPQNQNLHVIKYTKESTRKKCSDVLLLYPATALRRNPGLNPLLDPPLKSTKIAHLWHQPPNMVATAVSFQRASSAPFPSSEAFGRVPSSVDESTTSRAEARSRNSLDNMVSKIGIKSDPVAANQAEHGVTHHEHRRASSVTMPHMSLFGRVGSSGSNGGAYGEDRLALMTQTYYHPRCSEDRLHWAQRMAAHAEERSNDKESEKPCQVDRLAQLTNAYYLPPCSQASLHKAQREAARLSNEPA